MITRSGFLNTEQAVAVTLYTAAEEMCEFLINKILN